MATTELLSPRDHAIALAHKGFRVFPLTQGGKTPALDRDWRTLATSNHETVMELWSCPVFGHDQGYNVGIALDPGDIVVDVDVRDGKRGRESLELLEMLYGDLPPTYTVRTASGGEHRYFKAAPQSWAAKLAEHIDLKTGGGTGLGYVVGEGSRIGDRLYAGNGRDPAQRAAAPRWLVEIGHQPVDRVLPKATGSLVEEDGEAAIARATAWLEGSAPDSGTYRVACRVKDFGISEDKCVELLEDHWPGAEGKDHEHIAFRVGNAYRYGQNAIGAAAPEAEFEPVEVNEGAAASADGPAPSKKPKLAPGVVNLDDLDKVPPRQWLYGHKLSRKYTAFVASPGGVGKTAWVTSVALACASGRKLLHDQPHHPMRVWVYNLEDDLLEIRRRIAAAMRFHELPKETLDNLRINSGRDRGLKVVKLTNDSLVVQPDARELIARMRDERIELLIVDPFLRSHGVPENASEGQDEVMRVYADIAEQTGAAIVLLHHTKKGGQAGDQESMRGSSTQGGGARSVLTLTPMTAEDAGKLSIPELQRRLHVRVDDAKNNMSPPAASAEWIKLDSMRLNNGTPDYPQGDSVQVARAWVMPDAFVGVSDEDVEGCLGQIDAGLPDGERYSLRPQDRERWAGTLLMDEFGRSEQQAKEILRQWVTLGTIEVRDYVSEKQRKARKGVFLPMKKESNDE